MFNSKKVGYKNTSMFANCIPYNEIFIYATYIKAVNETEELSLYILYEDRTKILVICKETN